MCYLQSALMQMGGPTVVQLGKVMNPTIESRLDYPLRVLVRSVSHELIQQDLQHGSEKENTDNLHIIQADMAFLPLLEESASSLIMPHILETHTMPHQVLREVHRVLKSDGCLVLTGFNPVSLLSLQRYIYPKAVYRGQYYSLNRVKDWLQLLGFEVTGSAMFQYAPLINSPSLRKLTSFLELVGNRWLPMFGGGYMIVAKKRDLGTTFIGKTQFKKTSVRLGHVAAKVTPD